VNGPKRACSKFGSVAGVPETTNLCFRVSFSSILRELLPSELNRLGKEESQSKIALLT
jgi:hypothetical protein